MTVFMRSPVGILINGGGGGGGRCLKILPDE